MNMRRHRDADIFINGVQYRGATGPDSLLAAIEEAGNQSVAPGK